MLGVSLGPRQQRNADGHMADRLRTILQGWYQTPVNHAEFTTYNLRWSNIIADMFVPQRTFWAVGWCCSPACICCGRYAARNAQHAAICIAGHDGRRSPLLHTHSSSVGAGQRGLAGACADHTAQHKRRAALWRHRGAVSLAAALAFTLASLGRWIFAVPVQLGHNSGGHGLRDGYLWFYIKNIGLPFCCCCC